MCVKKDADGIVSYNINCDFANYGLAVQRWALYMTIARLKFFYAICLVSINA